jgi:RNA polymerase sigma-54 factor
MALSPKLALRQTTSLVMTPQLQQAIKLLQLSNQALSEFVETEIAENPLLERESGEGGLEKNEAGSESQDTPESFDAPSDAPSDTPSDDTASDGTPSDDIDGPLSPDTNTLATAENPPDANDAPLDTDFENVWTNDDRTDINDSPPPQFEDWGGGGASFEGEGYNLEEIISEESSLRDHLTSQANVAINDPGERLIAFALIDALDETGYLELEISDIAERLGTDIEQVEAVLEKTQTFDPVGIFARNLGECLALQLRDLDRLDPAMAAFTQNLELLARRDMAALKRVCGVDEEDLIDMVAEIRALDPKPGLSHNTEVAQTVIPDVLVRAMPPSTHDPDGGWHIELNAETLPRVLVNQSYVAEVKKVVRAKKDREYLSERLASANWLIKALHQRATTILKVSTEIVRAQDAFLNKGVKYLRPLTLREIADAIEMHESTVSRVTTNKFISTPRGVFELKYFFTAAIMSTKGGDSHSAEAVRYRIKELIGGEKPKSILSDDKIVNILSAEGVDIARRTVAKYRETLHIPSSVQRRREKSLTI